MFVCQRVKPENRHCAVFDRGLSSWLFLARCRNLGLHFVAAVKLVKHVVPEFYSTVVDSLDKTKHKHDFLYTHDGSGNILLTWVDK